MMAINPVLKIAVACPRTDHHTSTKQHADQSSTATVLFVIAGLSHFREVHALKEN